jgi:hypothetical protein
MKQTSKGRGNLSIRPSGRHDVFRPHPALFNPANIMVNGGTDGSARGVRDPRQQLLPIDCGTTEPNRQRNTVVMVAGIKPGPLTIFYQENK